MSSIIVNGAPFDLPPIPPNSGAGGGFAFAFAKGGSVLLNDALHYLTHAGPVPFFSLPNYFGDRGVNLMDLEFTPPNRQTLYEYLDTSGVVFGGWRRMPPNFALPLSPRRRAILFVRDPRDILISFYFYYRQAAPANDAFANRVLNWRGRLQQMPVDDFALEFAPTVRDRFVEYDALHTACDLRILRYEDVIFGKMQLLDGLCEHFKLVVSADRRREIVGLIDKRPSNEDANAHVRQVSPGDHVRKLRASTIAELNAFFSDVLVRYRYLDAPVRGP